MIRLFHAIYALPICSTFLLLLGLLILWSLMLFCCRTAEHTVRVLYKAAAMTLFLLWLAGVLHSTVFSRSSGTLIVYRDFFHHLKEYLFHNGDRELLRSLWMNVLLFVPGGLLLEFLWPGSFPRWLCSMLTVVLLTALSAGIETAQYRYALGVAEADDLLCNGTGALLGASIHELSCRVFPQKMSP